MPHYKAPDNSVHFIDSEEFIQLLPEGVIEITKEEADALTYVPPVVQPPEVPVVSEFQAKAALLQAGLLATVEAYMTLDTTDPFVKLSWATAQEFRRDSLTIQTLMPTLGLTEAQVDDLLTFAKTITA